MKILFVAGCSPATIFALAPLATTARNAGHETFMASNDSMVSTIAGTGIPPISVTSSTMLEFFTRDRQGNELHWPSDPLEHMLFLGKGFGRLAAASMDALLALAKDWRPDVVVGGTLSFGAALLARRLGVPYVRHTWDSGEPPEADLGAAEVLLPELTELGLNGLPDPDMLIELCPPSVRPADAPPAQLMRYVPSPAQRQLEPWMYTRSERTRVCVTAGARVSREQYYEYLRELAVKVSQLDVEVVVAVAEEIGQALRAELDGVWAGWLPLDVVARTCDLMVHHAGGGTSLTGMSAGVPQLLQPNMPSSFGASQRLAEYGAALMLLPGEDNTDRIVSSCEELLSNPSYAARAKELAAEIKALPSVVEVLAAVEKLAAG
ncbi:MAG: DUF1205 domain-containing protein [Kutzneria sp.]|nr:DUF1205 domain-containing protein [Kutzneria sp.]